MKFLILISCVALVVCHPSRKADQGLRIIGGDEAKAAQFPFAAAIYIQTVSSTTFCGGALLSNLWVLTAGHCVDRAVIATVHLGSNLLEGKDPNRLILASDNFVLHPKFNRDTLENDIGLIRFRLPVSFNDYIQPTHFFPIADLPGGAPATTFGWGQINDQSPSLSNELRYVKLATVTNEECRLVYGSQITDTMVCVSGNYNEGTCRGDSGSPLIQTVGGGHVLIVGIASFISQNGCESTDPSGFTRVFPYKVWITNVTGLSINEM